MKQITVAVVIPVGPTCEFDHVCDTIESVHHYVTSSQVIIVLDDSGKGTGVSIKERFRDVVILTTPRNYGRNAGLYLNLSRGLTHAYEYYSFDVLLRLDTDSLVIGPNPEADAIDYFHRFPDYGIIGSYRTDCNGDPRDFSWPRNQLAKEVSLRYLLANPLKRLRGWLFLRNVFHQSRKNGYEAGEHCMGGAYFISRECVGKLIKNNLLSRQEIYWSMLQEDHIIGLLIYSVRLRHGDFATGSFPMGLRWQGLPCLPDELMNRKKKVTHSTRFFEDMSEKTIRQYFREQRQRDKL
jgi:hypothetical protein